MSYGTSPSRYLENDVLSRSPEWLVPLLYEHLLTSLRRAGVQMENGDVEGRAESLSKANQIVLELAGSLDREKGGEVAQHLSSLYAYFALEILNLGHTRDVVHLRRLIDLVAELHEAWTQAAEQVAPRGRAAAAPRAAVA